MTELGVYLPAMFDCRKIHLFASIHPEELPRDCASTNSSAQVQYTYAMMITSNGLPSRKLKWLWKSWPSHFDDWLIGNDDFPYLWNNPLMAQSHECNWWLEAQSWWLLIILPRGFNPMKFPFNHPYGSISIRQCMNSPFYQKVWRHFHPDI